MFLEKIPNEIYESMDTDVFLDFYNSKRHLSNNPHGALMLSLRNTISEETNDWHYRVDLPGKNHIFWNRDVPNEIKEHFNNLENIFGIQFGKMHFSNFLSDTGLRTHIDKVPIWHYVVKTNPWATLAYLEDNVVKIAHMEQGCLYKANVDKYEHAVWNPSNEERIHVVAWERHKK